MDWRRTPESQELLLGGLDVLLPVGWLLSAEIRRFLATPRGETYPYLPKTPDELRHPFDGDVVVLTDGASYSASVYATWLLRHGADARVVGEGPGSGSWFHGQTVWTLLPHSRLGLQVATGTFRCGRDQPAEDVVADEPMDPDEAFRSLLGRPPR